jgi:murein DD-endopeptidase MepM/ murein hydrolase activator NlpD
LYDGIPLPEQGTDDGIVGFAIVGGDSLSGGGILGNIAASRDGISVYRVVQGDTLSAIAAQFGIPVETILVANRSARELIRPGQELRILPVPGVLHAVQEGETLDSIAGLYGIAPEKILAMNKTNISASHAIVGAEIIVPGAKANRTLATIRAQSLPSIAGYFSQPAKGWIGPLHPTNAVDIANACGTPIYSAAEGLVTRAQSGWNGGYGTFVEIEHPNGTKTLYAHNQTDLAQVGDLIAAKTLIAYMGQTGRATGCHVHFETRNARNSFAVY